MNKAMDAATKAPVIIDPSSRRLPLRLAQRLPSAERSSTALRAANRMVPYRFLPCRSAPDERGKGDSDCSSSVAGDPAFFSPHRVSRLVDYTRTSQLREVVIDVAHT